MNDRSSPDTDPDARRGGPRARLGGDELAVLLPDTHGDAARAALDEVRDLLKGEMRSRGCPVTFSIGLVTCTDPPASVDERVKCADDLMDVVKKGGRDAIHVARFPELPPP